MVSKPHLRLIVATSLWMISCFVNANTCLAQNARGLIGFSNLAGYFFAGKTWPGNTVVEKADTDMKLPETGCGIMLFYAAADSAGKIKVLVSVNKKVPVSVKLFGPTQKLVRRIGIRRQAVVMLGNDLRKGIYTMEISQGELTRKQCLVIR